MRNGKLNIDWNWFPKARDSVVDAVAPITSKLVGPIATALTGVPVPNPADLLAGNKDEEKKAKDLLGKMLDQPMAFSGTKTGKGFKKLKK